MNTTLQSFSPIFCLFEIISTSLIFRLNFATSSYIFHGQCGNGESYLPTYQKTHSTLNEKRIKNIQQAIETAIYTYMLQMNLA